MSLREAHNTAGETMQQERSVEHRTQILLIVMSIRTRRFSRWIRDDFVRMKFHDSMQRLDFLKMRSCLNGLFFHLSLLWVSRSIAGGLLVGCGRAIDSLLVSLDKLNS